MLKYLLALSMVFSAFAVSNADIITQVNLGQYAEASSVKHWDDSNFDDAISDGVVVTGARHAESSDLCSKKWLGN